MSTHRRSRSGPPARNPPPPDGMATATAAEPAAHPLASPSHDGRGADASTPRRYRPSLPGLVDLLSESTAVAGRELGRLSNAELVAIDERAEGMLQSHTAAIQTVTHMLATINSEAEAPHPAALAGLLTALGELAQVANELGGWARHELELRRRGEADRDHPGS